ncbi:hypothetical protein ANN_21964 [Periplaneta americana]|uniref:Uncharacterized protein n=1 Tax=Periplaneta americana TaxID=6978 RepID=A0ABQ8S725_PERAM|nr:hypothetical protein ANN_21964 [Periplaneta americana]
MIGLKPELRPEEANKWPNSITVKFNDDSDDDDDDDDGKEVSVMVLNDGGRLGGTCAAFPNAVRKRRKAVYSSHQVNREDRARAVRPDSHPILAADNKDRMGRGKAL